MIPLRALTLFPEWAWAICHLGKRVENRPWFARDIIGQTLAIHAGRRIGGRDGAAGERAALTGLSSMAVRAGWDVAFDGGGRLHFETKEGARGPQADLDLCTIPRSAIVATATVVGIVSQDADPWAVPGLRHWALGEVRVLPAPVPCPGARMLWQVPAQVVRLVQERASCDVVFP